MHDVIVPALVRNGFFIKMERRDPLCLAVSGNADLDVSPLLGPYLAQLHQLICLTGLRAVVVDFRDLYFMNSSCFKAFLVWVTTVSQLKPKDRYDIRFVSNPRLHWQRRSLEAIRGIAPAVVGIDLG